MFRLQSNLRELTLGLYKDSNGEFIYAEKDEWGDVTETIEEYAQRVAANSEEYVKIMKIAILLDVNSSGLIKFASSVS